MARTISSFLALPLSQFKMSKAKTRTTPAAKKPARTSSRSTKPTVDLQRKNSGKTSSSGRASDGTFAPGNRHGFQPGQSGNPAGRPKSALVSAALRAQLQEPAPDAAITLAEKVAATLLQQCLKGNVKAIKEVMDRTEGKARQPVELVRERQTADIAIQQLMDRIGCSREKAIELLAPMLPSVAELAG